VIYAALGALTGIVVFLIGSMIIMHARYNQTLEQMSVKAFEKEQAWASERRDLLDRIQAPSFAEYSNKVIREKKAEKPEERPEPIEFIS